MLTFREVWIWFAWVKIRYEELPLLNKQLDRLNYVTLGDLAQSLKRLLEQGDKID